MLRSNLAYVKEPTACTARELEEFARLVRRGFEGAVDLERRIREARWLAFHFAAPDTLAAVAALKVPSTRHREDIFRKADALIDSSDYKLDLGWVYVAPSHRQGGIATDLCTQLLAHVPTSGVFATTRPTNHAMIRILQALGFTPTGKPYRRGEEELTLLLRPSQ